MSISADVYKNTIKTILRVDWKTVVTVYIYITEEYYYPLYTNYLPLMFGRCPSDPGKDSSSGLWDRLSSFRFWRLLIEAGTFVMALLSRCNTVKLFNVKITAGIPPVISSSENIKTALWLLITNLTDFSLDYDFILPTSDWLMYFTFV